MSSTKHKPLLAITQGDPTGVGPEVIVGAWREAAVHDLCRAVVIGHPEVLRRAVKLVNSPARVVPVESVDAVASSPAEIPCLRSGSDDAADAPAGVVDPRGGQSAYDALVAAARLALDKQIDGIVTAPLHKVALARAGHHYPGHTELLAELCGARDFAMMLYLPPNPETATPGLGVVHVTLHTALRDALNQITTDGILAKAKLADSIMRVLNGSPPRIGVCAINPHAGEDGLFGDEEKRIIAPAVELASRQGLTIEGPLPTDTLFVRARECGFDAVVAMYHDQGHIAIKLLGMHRAVNVTLGLPIVRTSVAHGTAFDLAWQGRAESSSMVEAIRIAARLATSFRLPAT